MKNYKKDFPIFANNKNLVYLDSAATSQKPKVVLDAILDYYQNYNANVRRGLYPIAEKATEKVEEIRRQIAKFIHAKDSSEIIFVRNTTEAINLVMNTMDDGSFDVDTNIVTTIMEHHSNFVPWQFLANLRQSPFLVVDIDSDGILNRKDLVKKTKNAKLLAITYVSNVLGTINPIKEIIQEVRKENKNIIILVDGAQAVPHMQVDMQDLDCDFLAFSGHKMMAGTGIGVLYGKKRLLAGMSPFLFGSDMIKEVTIEKTIFDEIPGKFEAGTPDIAGIISLGAAIEYINSIGIKTIQNHEKELVVYCLSLLSKIDGITVYGPQDIDTRGGVISFTVEGIHPHDIAQFLGDKNICIRAGHHCAMPLHKRLGVAATARAGFYLYNTEKDVDEFIDRVKKVKKIFSK